MYQNKCVAIQLAKYLNDLAALSETWLNQAIFVDLDYNFYNLSGRQYRKELMHDLYGTTLPNFINERMMTMLDSLEGANVGTFGNMYAHVKTNYN